MIEPDLFTYYRQHDAGLARLHDPDTSHAAAESVDATALEAIVHHVIKSFGPAGCISDDVLKSLPAYTYGTITPRYHPLIAKGLIVITGEKRKGVSGRSQRVMVAV